MKKSWVSMASGAEPQSRGFQVGADTFADCREHEGIAEREPEGIGELGLFIVAAHEGLLGARENRCGEATAFLDAWSEFWSRTRSRSVGTFRKYSGAASFNSSASLVKVGGKRQDAVARERGEEQDPGRGEAERSVMKDALWLGARAHQFIEARICGADDVIYISGGEDYAFGFAGGS